MNIKSKKLKAVVAQSKRLQKQYDSLNSPATQRIRNPFPLWQLVLGVLPKLPDPQRKIRAKVSVKLTHFGKKFVQTRMMDMPVSECLGKSFWEERGMTAGEIFQTLKDEGFIVAKSSIYLALHRERKLGGWSTIGSVTAPTRAQRGRGAPIKKYFFTPTD